MEKYREGSNKIRKGESTCRYRSSIDKYKIKTNSTYREGATENSKTTIGYKKKNHKLARAQPNVSTVKTSTFL